MFVCVTERERDHLRVCADGAFALCAGVGADLVEALGAHGLLVLLHIFLALQVFAAVEAVKAVGHGGGEVAPGSCQGESEGELLVDTKGGSVAPTSPLLSP